MLHYTPRPRPCHHRPCRHRPRAGSLCSTTLPHRGYVCGPLVPLARGLGAWLALPGPSRWLLRTIRLGYAIQFARRPPKFRGVHFTSVKAVDAPVLCAEIAVLLAKDAIERVPPADMRSGFYSPYFIVPKRSGGLRPILDLRVLNRALHKLPFKMMTRKRIFGCVRPLDWFAAIDLKDMCFHDSILPRHRASLHSRSRVVHVSTRSCLSGISASWVFRSTGERANSCQCRGSLFSAWSWIRSTRQHASPRYVLSRC